MEVKIPERIQNRPEEVRKEPKLVAEQIGSGYCGLVVIVYPPGDPRSREFNCGGGCGFIDRILGRSCQKLAPGTGDGGVKVFWACTGGWFDRIFGSA